MVRWNGGETDCERHGWTNGRFDKTGTEPLTGSSLVSGVTRDDFTLGNLLISR